MPILQFFFFDILLEQALGHIQWLTKNWVKEGVEEGKYEGETLQLQISQKNPGSSKENKWKKKF